MGEYKIKKKKSGYALVKEFDSNTRMLIKVRDMNRCIFCGTMNDIQLHHIVYRSDLGMGILENGVCLCKKCHDLVHSSKKKYQPILKKYIESKYGVIDWHKVKYKKNKKPTYNNRLKGVE